jgi:hypothetical protein
MDSQDFVNDVDIKARELLGNELQTVGVTDAVVIWPDEGRAYLDSGKAEDYYKVAAHFQVVFDGEDKSPVDEALLNRYNELFAEDAPEAIQKATMQVVVLSEQKPQGWAGPASWGHGTEGTEMLTWQGKDGWYGCLQGQGQGGNWFESEDDGPYDTREEAEKAMRVYYAESQEEVPSTGREE